MAMLFACTYAFNETNLMHYLSSVYSVTIPLHVLGLLVAHHQEVTMYMCIKWYMYILVDCQQAWLGWDWLCRVEVEVLIWLPCCYLRSFKGRW
jgi:hypothetical protein